MQCTNGATTSTTITTATTNTTSSTTTKLLQPPLLLKDTSNAKSINMKRTSKGVKSVNVSLEMAYHIRMKLLGYHQWVVN